MVHTLEQSEANLAAEGDQLDQLESAVSVHSPASYRSDEYNEFSYRPVPVVAVIGLVLSLLSLIAIFMWLAMPLCVLGFLVSGAGLWVIQRSAGAYGGKLVAATGLVLSAVSMTAGILYQVNLYQNEVPPGFERISFVNDISEKGFVSENGVSRVHPDVEELIGKKLFIKGYIYQTGKLRGLQSFLFVKDNQSCCFGANPAITDQIGVVMAEGQAIDYKAGKVAVAGTFRVNPKFNNEDGNPLYILEGEYFSSRVSDF